jgi:hypothetical protein
MKFKYSSYVNVCLLQGCANSWLQVIRAIKLCTSALNIWGVLSVEGDSCQPSGAQKFEVAPRSC